VVCGGQSTNDQLLGKAQRSTLHDAEVRFGDYVVYRLLAIAAILFCWIRMKVVQQLTCLTLGRPSGLTYLTGELLNTPLVKVSFSTHLVE